MSRRFDFSRAFALFNLEENSGGSPITKFDLEEQEKIVAERIIKSLGHPIKSAYGAWGFMPGDLQVLFCSLDSTDDQRYYVAKEDFRKLYNFAKEHKIVLLYLSLKLLSDTINNNPNVPDNEKLWTVEGCSFDLSLFYFYPNTFEVKLPDKKTMIKYLGNWDFKRDRRPARQLLSDNKLDTLFSGMIALAELGLLEAQSVKNNMDEYFKLAASCGSYHMLILISLVTVELRKSYGASVFPSISQTVKNLNLVAHFFGGTNKQKNTNSLEEENVAHFLASKYYDIKTGKMEPPSEGWKFFLAQLFEKEKKAPSVKASETVRITVATSTTSPGLATPPTQLLEDSSGASSATILLSQSSGSFLSNPDTSLKRKNSHEIESERLKRKKRNNGESRSYSSDFFCSDASENPSSLSNTQAVTEMDTDQFHRMDTL